MDATPAHPCSASIRARSSRCTWIHPVRDGLDVCYELAFDANVFYRIPYYLMGLESSHLFSDAFDSIQPEFQHFATRELVHGVLAWNTIKAALAARQHTSPAPHISPSAVPNFALTQHPVSSWEAADFTVFRQYNDDIAPELAFPNLQRDCVVHELFSRFILFKMGSVSPDFETILGCEFADIDWHAERLTVAINLHSADVAEELPDLFHHLSQFLGLKSSDILQASVVHCNPGAEHAKILSVTERTGCSDADINTCLTTQFRIDHGVRKWMGSLPKTFNARRLAGELN